MQSEVIGVQIAFRQGWRKKTGCKGLASRNSRVQCTGRSEFPPNVTLSTGLAKLARIAWGKVSVRLIFWHTKNETESVQMTTKRFGKFWPLWVESSAFGGRKVGGVN
jgi:hypothetical protein